MVQLEQEIKKLQELNPHLSEMRRRTSPENASSITRVMVAGSGLTAKRMVLALNEEGISSVVPVCDGERGRSWYEFADEPVFIGSTPTHQDIERVIAACLLSKVDAVYPVYDFIRLNPDFVDALQQASGNSIRIMGPGSETLRNIGAREFPRNTGSKRVIVQLVNDLPLGIRVRGEDSGLEESGGELPVGDAQALLHQAKTIARDLDFQGGVASLEFVKGAGGYEAGEFRPGLETGCAVLEEALGLDLAQAHIRCFAGRGDSVDPLEQSYRTPRIAIGCHIIAYPAKEDVVRELEPAGFCGVRNDFVLSQGDRPDETGLIGETIVHGSTRRAALKRLERALRELYLRGVRTNLDVLLDRVRRELEELTPISHERRSFQEDSPVILGAFTEYISTFSRTAMKLALLQDPERGLGDPRLTRSPTSFRVTLDGRTHRVDFMRLGLNRYGCFVDQKFRGDISLTNDGRGNPDDYGILYENRSLRVRVDKIGSELVLFVWDSRSRARYISMEVVSGDARPPGDLGAVRAPIQGTFVRFGERAGRPLRVGDSVKQGDLLVVLSSMKMETSVHAPVSGVLSFIVEDGEAERLTLGHTPDGRTIGKPLAESELLAVVANTSEASASSTESAGDIRDTLFGGSFKEYALANFAESLPFLLDLADSYFRGYIQQEHVIRDLIEILDANLEKGNPSDTRESFSNVLESILLHYGGIRRLFSPELAGELSFFAEFGVFAYGPEPDDYQPSEKFDALITSLFNSYGVKQRSDEIFLLFQRAYHASREHPELLRALLDLSYYKFPKNTALFLGDFMNTVRFARLDLDRALLEFMLLKKRTRRSRAKGGPQTDPAKVAAALFNHDDVTKAFPAWAETRDIAGRESAPRGIASTRERVALFADDHSGSYLAVTWADAGLEGLRAAYRDGLEALAAATRDEYRENNRLEILASPDCELDLIGRIHTAAQPSVIGREALRGVLAAERMTAGNLELAGGLLRIKARTVFEADPEFVEVLFQEKRGTFQFEYLAPSDPRNPRATESLRDPRDAKVFARSKWPIEYWAELAFDQVSVGSSVGPREIRIPSIDGEGETSPVGARIYAGLMRKAPALFFMKDSRVKGGATGNLEGLKYVAAVFLARRLSVALYIWNDGAGANIKEGIPALNRAAQGFMMNAIFAERVSDADFERYTLKNHDDTLRKLFAELDERFADRAAIFGEAVVSPTLGEPEQRPLLAAVGTGSSAGLDVYGSSQAVLQVMLDSEQSYRVLTGSNVVRAVTGEDISNYDIGGGEVMGGLTGIVDRIAENKLELVDVIRRLHDLFARREILPGIRRVPTSEQEASGGLEHLVVLSESKLRADLDDGEFFPIKSEYREAGSLVGGFARLGGRRVLILGPRSRFGLRGAASTIRARELLRMSNRTATPRLLVFGPRWFQRISRHEPGEWRARSDFLKTLNRSNTPQISIITHMDGMQAAELNSRSDILIYVRGDEPVSRFARDNAGFIADSRSRAFDLACRLLDYLEGAEQSQFVEPPGKPGIPADITRPYDIIETVIQHVVDRESFLEIFREMNDPVRGPSLVTGFARLGGKVVGIIADQPLIMGGAPDAPGTEKFRVFTELLNRFNIPLLMLSNAPGFMPGTRQERLRIQAVGGESLDVNVLGHIPVVSVVLNQNYGGRLIHAFGKHLRPGIVYIAPPDALLAVMGASAAFDLFYGPKFNELMQAGQKEEAGELHRKFFEEFNEKSRAASDAAKTGSLDWLIPDISELREHLIKGLAAAREHCLEVFES